MAICPEDLADMMLDGLDEEAWQEIQKVNKHLALTEIYEDLLTPAMYHVGELWQKNKISVADEHLATATCDFLLSRLEGREDNRKSGAPKALLFGVAEEQHYLGLRMAASIFREHGWSVKYLGPNLPAEQAFAFAKKWQPQAVAMSAALSYRLPSLFSYIEAFTELKEKPAVLLGGKIARERDVSELFSGKVIRMDGLRTLENWIAGEGGDDVYARSHS
ncbi:cobalamin B12-binding domain-containing protein [Marinococcus halotolerans]|uniref:cobalamin B12-binding domain-containing protein n=1 Tax=Marinococcus halotolerans TaxID=301092 RepID=UPI0003B676AC|nr:B12-binding domain-containing protein [Marinococcus halotolerans]